MFILTVLSNVVSQEPLSGESFATVITHQRLCVVFVVKTEFVLLKISLIVTLMCRNSDVL